jgi:hypothetical protein
MVEMETILAPVTFGDESPVRFIGLTQILSDTAQLGGKPIAFERLVGSQLVQEDEPLSANAPPPPPMPPSEALRSHPRAPHLRLVVSHDRPAIVHTEMDEMMLRMIAALDIVTQPAVQLVPANRETEMLVG